MNIKEYIKEQRLITDGAMGTYYEEKYSEDTVIAEKENLKNPEQIKEIHLEYLRAGARLIRTNTFAANTMFLADMQEVKETVRAGYEIAKEAVTAFQAENGKEIPVFIGADLGPIYDLDRTMTMCYRSTKKFVTHSFLVAQTVLYLRHRVTLPILSR